MNRNLATYSALKAGDQTEPLEPSRSLADADLVSLGSEIRQVRQARQLTLRDVAQHSGVSVSHLSAIERNTANPSIDVVNKLARALDIDPSWFFPTRDGQGPYERAFVVRKRNRRDLNKLYREEKDEIGLSDELLSSSIAGALILGVAEYEPHSARPGHAIYQHEGEQHGFILKGQLELQIADEFITLNEGDSFSFPTEIVHNARNTTDRPALLVWAISPIVIPSDVAIGRETEIKEGKTGE